MSVKKCWQKCLGLIIFAVKIKLPVREALDIIIDMFLYNSFEIKRWNEAFFCGFCSLYENLFHRK